MQLGEHTQSAANCIPPAEVALNLEFGDFERNGERVTYLNTNGEEFFSNVLFEKKMSK